MKIFPDPQLPLRPAGIFERYALHQLESRERWLGASATMFILMVSLWALYHELWVFGWLAAFNLIHVILGLEARALRRMIQRSYQPAAPPSAPKWLDHAADGE